MMQASDMEASNVLKCFHLFTFFDKHLEKLDFEVIFRILSSIMVITFWIFFMDEQIFFSPQVKQSKIISNNWYIGVEQLST